MRIVTATEPADASKASEDWILAEPDLAIALDGATARTDTGCRHGIAWYAAKLGSAITDRSTDPGRDLKAVLAGAIAGTRDQHRDCDLDHPGTPSAAVGIVRPRGVLLEYLVLGDVTLLLDTVHGLNVITDDRVDQTAIEQRADAARYPFGTAEKQAALLRMKHAELAVRNQPGGFWVAAADPAAADQAITGSLPAREVRRLALLTDGAARAVVLFQLMDWRGLLDVLAKEGPSHLIGRVRAAEMSDHEGIRWPRNKRCDDASAIFIG